MKTFLLIPRLEMCFLEEKIFTDSCNVIMRTFKDFMAVLKRNKKKTGADSLFFVIFTSDVCENKRGNILYNQKSFDKSRPLINTHHTSWA